MIAKMSMLRAFICLAVSALILDITAATNYTVGSPPGSWDTSTDLNTWADSQLFVVGDNLVFQYTSNHDVLEVTEANYDNCQTTNPIQMYMGGNNVIPLTTAGKRYFICGTSGHCGQGMKVEIDTLAATTPAPPPGSPQGPPASSPPPGTPRGPPASSPPTGSPSGPPASSPPPGSPRGPPSTPGVPESPPSTTLPPPPSSATKMNLMVGSTTGLVFFSMMILAI